MKKNEKVQKSSEEMVSISRAEYEEFQAQREKISELEKQVELLMEAIRLSRKKQYGSSSEKTYDDGMEALNQLMELENKPTAIFVNSDEAALGVIHAAQDLGISIPEDLEVISSDNTRLALMVRPRLTTIVQPLYDIGAVSMRLLTKLMNKEAVEQQSVILPHRIEMRASGKG